MPGARCFLGVDVGGTNLRAAAADDSGRVLAQRNEAAGSLTARDLAARVSKLACELCPAGPAAVGIGLPGPVSEDGEIGPIANLPGLMGAEARALLEEELGVPVAIDNDVNLAALAEHLRGCAQGIADLAFIAVGTGVGMGIISGGRLLHGATGGAGELGTHPLAPDQAAADPRALGPLESVAGGAGLAAHWAERRGDRAASHDVFTAATAGQEAALDLLAEQAGVLAMAVRAVQALLDPELIVLGGGIGARPDVLARLGEALAADGLPHPRLEPSALGEHAGLIGAVEAARAAVPAAREAAIR